MATSKPLFSRVSLRFLSFLTGACLVLALHLPLSAQGVFTGPTWQNGQLATVGKVDIHVLVDPALTITDADLFTYFNIVSQQLYDATEKQVQLGKVFIYRGGPAAKDKADILLSSSITRGYTYVGQSAPNFGQGGAYGRIYVSPGNLTGARPVVVHEMGHLVFNIYDSYLGFLRETASPNRYVIPLTTTYGYRASPEFYWDSGTVPAPDTRNTFFDTTDWDTNSPACIMDGPWVGETEFSTPAGQGWVTDHVLPYVKNISWSTAPNGSTLTTPFQATVDVVTKQNNLRNNQSAWETLISFRPSMMMPASAPTSDITGHVDIEMHYVPDINELGICLDRSGSMYGSPLDLAKKSAGLVVDLAHEGYTITTPTNVAITVPGDRISVTAFDTFANLIFSQSGQVAPMTAAAKTTAKNAISTIVSGATTSIGDGLIVSSGTFTTGPFPKSIILLSDGQENTAPFISSVIPTLTANNIRVYTVGLGSGADKAILQNLATQTRGSFFFADNETELPGIFAVLYGYLRSDSFLKLRVKKALELPTGPFPFGASAATSDLQEEVNVDDAVAEVTFLATWAQGGAVVDLFDPDGAYISDQNYPSYPGVSYLAGPGYGLYRVVQPKSGSWQVRVTPDVAANFDWELRAFAIDVVTQFNARTDQTAYVYPAPVVIHASCAAPQPVIGGTATAQVARPDGSVVAIKLYDNGDVTATGDSAANDGIYSCKFSSFNMDGAYLATVKFDSTGGMTPSPQTTTGIEWNIPLPGDPPALPQPVPSFERYKQLTFTVSGVPEIVPAAVTVNPETLNLKSKGTVITAYLELTLPYDAKNIVPSSIIIRHEGNVITGILPGVQTVGDFDADGTRDLTIKFARNKLVDYLKANRLTKVGALELTVEGCLSTGELFTGTSRIRVIQ